MRLGGMGDGDVERGWTGGGGWGGRTTLEVQVRCATNQGVDGGWWMVVVEDSCPCTTH